MTKRAALLALFGGFLLCLFAAAMPDDAENLARVQMLYERAQSQYRNLSLDEAEEILGQILTDSWLLNNGAAGRDLLIGSYELRGVCRYNLGNKEGAQQDFAELVMLAPDHAFNPAYPSRVAEEFEAVRNRMTASLKVTSEPAGAQVFVDGLAVGTTPLDGHRVLASARIVKVHLQGYKSYEAEIKPQGGKIAEVRAALTPTHRAALFFTSPPGAEVFVDDQSAGLTSGAMEPLYAEIATKRGLDPAVLSAAFLTAPLAEGEHTARFVLPCYATEKIAFTVRLEEGRALPMIFEPIVLVPSTGALEVHSEPAGLEVRVDGLLRGKTPLRLSDVCSGVRLVEAGDAERRISWFQDVTVEKGGNTVLTASPRPTLAVLGVRREQSMELRDKHTSDLMQSLASDGRFNLIPPVRLPSPAASESVLSYLSRSQMDEKADLYLLGVDTGVQVRYYLSAVSGVADAFDTPQALFEALKAPAQVFTSTLGLEVLDVAYARGALVYHVPSGGPAAKAGVKPGDIVTALQGRGVASAKDFYDALHALNPGVSVPLKLEGREEPLMVPLYRSPRMVSLETSGEGVQKTIASLRFMSRAAADPVEKAAANLNLGVLLYRVGKIPEALEALSGAEFADGRRGIGEGTVLYLKALAWLQGGKTSQAREALDIAAREQSATLGHDFGMPLAAIARRLQGQIP